MKVIEARTQSQAIDAMMEKISKSLLWTENQYSVELARHFKESTDDLISRLQNLNNQALSGGAYDVDEWRRLRLDHQSWEIIRAKTQQMGSDYSGFLAQRVEDQYRQAYNYYSWMLDSSTPPFTDITYNAPTDAFIRQYIAAPFQGYNFSEKLGQITDDMARDIQNQLMVSMTRGDSVRDMASAIRDTVGVDPEKMLKTRPRASAALARAMTITRTEMIRASRNAQDLLFGENADILDDKAWSIKYGGFGVCAECLLKDGKTPSQIIKMGLSTEEHPNGRCLWVPKVKPWKELLGDELSKGMKDEVDWGKLGDEAMVSPDDSGKWISYSKIDDYETWAKDNLSPYELGRTGTD